MSFMNSTPDDVAEKASGLQAGFNDTVTKIKNDRNLSPEGKAQQLAKAYIAHSDTMAGMREDFETKEAQHTASLHRDLFGSTGVSGADAVSQRDAADRAAKYDSREALAALRRAERDGDETLMRAIAARANDEGASLFGNAEWAPVLQEFTASRPNLAAKLDELNSGTQSAMRRNFGREMIFAAMKPRELERYTDHQIRQIAAGQPLA